MRIKGFSHLSANQRLSRDLLVNVCAIIFVAFITITHAEAFDDKRTGFIIAFGGGGQVTNHDFDFESVTNTQDYATGEDVGLALQLSIGGAFSERFAITGTHQVSRVRVNNEGYTSYLLGITGTHWFRATRPSVYIAGTVGRLSVLTDTYVIDVFNFGESATGYAGRFAVGYEFASRLHLEGGLTYGKSDNGFDQDGPRLETTSAQVIASFVWY